LKIFNVVLKFVDANDAFKTMARNLRNITILILLCLGSAELSVRLAGLSPVPRPSRAVVHSGIFMEDSQLGWFHRPNVKQAFRITGELPHTVTIVENGARATGPRTATRASHRDLIFVGCSFTFGWGLNDEETFAWKVQTALPHWNVHNFGVNGYGTCQSYMLLKRLIQRGNWHNPVVIYGFLDDHEKRNVAYYVWHYALSVLTSTGTVWLPSCMLDSAGAIAFNAPRPYPHFPFRHTLAVIPVFEQLYLWFEGASLARQSQAITERLLVEMQEVTTAQSGNFGVLFFNRGGPRESHYRQFLANRGIRIIDFDPSEQEITGALTFFDGHPNGRMADLIAQSVVSFVRSLGV
jgi:hypothetical protein